MAFLVDDLWIWSWGSSATERGEGQRGKGRERENPEQVSCQARSTYTGLDPMTLRS